MMEVAETIMKVKKTQIYFLETKAVIKPLQLFNKIKKGLKKMNTPSMTVKGYRI